LRNLLNRSIQTPFFGFLFVVATFFFISGCGVKGDPLLSGLVLPPAVKDLAAAKAPAGVRLMWTMPASGIEGVRVQIFRSTLAVAGDSCSGCPRTFELAAEPTLRELLREGGAQRAAYVDTRVEPGLLYTYMIVLCDASGFCGRQSNKAEIKFKEAGSNK
jgi:hypothetical protein